MSQSSTFVPPARTSNASASAPDAGDDARYPHAGRVFIVFGPPASGKGTQCKMLAASTGLVHLSTGDIFRDLCERRTELGLRAKEYMEKGCFVPDEFVLSFIRDRLAQTDVRQRGCLLDGFPRTADQAQELQRLVNVDGVLALHVPDKTLMGRAAKRRIDPATGDIYHLDFVPPPAELADRLVPRDRDDEQSFRQRIDVFHGQSRRVLPFFSGKTWRIEGTLEPKEVFSSISRCINSASAKPGDAPQQVAPQEDGKCCICFDEKADHLVVPCGHQCGCEECLNTVKQHSGRCPICRGPVSALQKVFRCSGAADAAGAARRDMLQSGEAGHQGHADIEDTLDKQVDADAEDDWSDDGMNVEPEDKITTIAVAPCKDVPKEGGEVNIAVTIGVEDRAHRAPADICCCVDVSGSMGSRATYEDENGNMKDDGLSVLDIVKHAVKTVIKSLKAGDRLALVAFDHKATTALELTDMNESGQRQALEVLEDLRPGGQTNIWGGIHASMEALRAADPAGRETRLQATLLLTDGQPNVQPPQGHLEVLRDYKDTHPEFSFQLNTFGFGYSLDSQLLLDLAKEGNGTYAFIPDAIIVGTTFVNSVANVLSTLAQSSTVSLMPKNGAEIVGPVSGGLDELTESWGRAISLGPLQFGQPRDLVVKVRVPELDSAGSQQPYLEAVLSYTAASGGADGRTTGQGVARDSSVDARIAWCRARSVSTGYNAIQAGVENKGKEAGNMVAELNKMFGQVDAVVAADGRFTALLADTSGRMSKALQGKERFNRWGKHYLRALMRSHQMQICTNFMDPGLQPYGGELFRQLREKGDAIFLSLPPPQPATQRRGSTTSCQSSAPAAPVMTTYYAGAGGGCFAPSSLVTKVSSSGAREEVPIEDVRAGDLLLVADGSAAAVRCVVRIARDSSRGLVELPSGLRITGRHPVRIDDRWILPRNAPGARPVSNEAGFVINVVLERSHVLLVNGTECITWGHGFTGDVIEHPFFGTAAVLQSLTKLPGWECGFVRVYGLVRDSLGQVVDFWGETAELPALPYPTCSASAAAADAAHSAVLAPGPCLA